MQVLIIANIQTTVGHMQLLLKTKRDFGKL